MSFRRMALALSAAGALSVMGAVAQTTTSSTSTVTSSSGPIGLGSTETLQINVVNVASNSSGGTAASCAGTIGFVNSSGTAIGSATSFTVASGQISSVSLPFSKAGASGTRTEVRAVVTLTVTTGSGAAPCELRSSLETYDSSTGATHAFVSSGPADGGHNGGPGFGH